MLACYIYEKIRLKCRGWIKVYIYNDVCHIIMRFDGIEYRMAIVDVTKKVINGEFTVESVSKQFVQEWWKYYLSVQRKRLFYEEEP